MRLLTGSVLVLLLAGCGPAAAQALPTQAEAVINATAAATLPGSSSAGPSATFTSEPFALQFTPGATDTPLPLLELPTLQANPPAMQVWDGLPTYPAESKPGFDFRLQFDPLVWALTTDDFGFPALAHRQVSRCFISPATGRGLPLNGTVQHDTRKLGSVGYQVNSAYVNGVRQFVNYAGGDANVYSIFKVVFEDGADRCLADAEVVLGTLSSVPALLATPVGTP